MERNKFDSSTPERARMQVKYLENIQQEYLDQGVTSARWSIEYSERYNSLEEGLNELYEEDEIDVEPEEVLVAIGKQDYEEAKELLEPEED